MKSLLLYISLLFIAGCINNLCNNSTALSSQKFNSGKKIKHDIDSIAKTTELNFGKNRLVVETIVVNDSLLSGNLVLDFKVIQQKLLFYEDGNELKTFLFNPRKVEIRTSHINKCAVNENVINEISVLQGENGWLFCISGGGITGNQTEYSGLFTPEGELVYFSYSSSRNKDAPEIPNEQKGNLAFTLNKYGIDTFTFLHPKTVHSVDY